jgi:ketosteroid isomerase-like protein
MVPGPMTSADIDGVLAANAAFYAAFEERDLDAMSQLWEHSDRVLCTHPGWARLQGWGQVAASFFALFQNAQRLQFILTNESAEVVGDTGWVAVDENILDTGSATTVSAFNVFTRDPAGEWAMVVHHGSAVSGSDTGEGT